jgi:methylated-DNA-[protein]-cysteine S-methyltransferase
LRTSQQIAHSKTKRKGEKIMTVTYYTHMDSPVGKLFLAGRQDGLTEIRFENENHLRSMGREKEETQIPFREAIRQLKAYFAGELKVFNLPLKPEGTPFQLAVWQALQEIPYGETLTYGELALRIHRPKACRAVGAANGQNPLSIVIPCHRVIGSGGRLTGYGGGLKAKAYLLTLESNGALSLSR